MFRREQCLCKCCLPHGDAKLSAQFHFLTVCLAP
jgi:hypothetical protein